MDPVLRNKEIAARLVLRECWQNGHHYVDLRRDGRAIVYYCKICNIYCYNDFNLADHLSGSKHKRKLANTATSVTPSLPNDAHNTVFGQPLQLADVMKGKTKNDSPTKTPENLNSPSLPPSLEWFGSGKIYLSEDQSDPFRQVWCQWLGVNDASAMSIDETIKETEGSAYGIVIFPYSDVIGRKPVWKPEHLLKKGEDLSLENMQAVDLLKKPTNSGDENKQFFLDLLSGEDLLSCSNCGGDNQKKPLPFKDLTLKSLYKVMPEKRMNLIQRFCFICRQRMLPGKTVSALLNLRTGRMMCSSRNERGAFHVFHPSCLVDWILLSESKFKSSAAAKKNVRKMRGQINKKARKAKSKALSVNLGPLFCPECQGTGVEVHGHQLEKPRYSLAQVFEWVLELIQARRSWAGHPEKQHVNSRGLILSELNFENTGTCLGSVQLYAAGGTEFIYAACTMK